MKTRPFKIWLLSVTLLLGGLGCQRCAKSGFDPLSLAPSSSAAVIVVEPLGAIAPSLQRALLLVQGEERAQLEELKGQLGFDPTQLEGWREAGMDPARPALAIGASPDGALVFLLPVSDATKLEQSARRLAERFGRADKVGELQISGKRALSFGRSFGDREVQLATLLIEPKWRYALLGTGQAGAGAIEGLLATTPDGSMASSARFKAARGKVRKGPFFAWTGGAAAAALADGLGGSAELVSHVVLSGGADKSALWIDSLAGLSVAARDKLSASLALDTAPPDMFAIADKDAVAVAAGTANVASMLESLEQAAGKQGRADLEAVARSAGVDLDREVLKRLRGGIGGLFYLRDVAALAPVVRQPRALARNAGRVLEIFLVAELTVAGVDEIPKVLADYFAGRGREITARTTPDGSVSTVAIGSGDQPVELHYAVRGKRLLFGIGAGARYDALLSRLGGSAGGTLSKTLSADMREILLGKPGGQLYLSFSTLAQQLTLLSQAPSLSDPAVRSLLIKVSEAVARFGALAASVRAEDEGLRVRARLELSPAPVKEAAP